MLPLLVLALAAPSVPAKVTNPLKGSLHPATAKLKRGAAIDFTLELVSSVTFPAVEIELTVPAGMTLLSGGRRVEWRDVRAGEKRTLRYRLRLDGKGEQRVQVVARVLGLDGAEVSQVVIAVVNPAPPGATRPPEVKTDAEGNTYRVQDLGNGGSPGR